MSTINEQPKVESCPFIGGIAIPMNTGRIMGNHQGVQININIPTCIGDKCKFWEETQQECLIKLGLAKYLKSEAVL